MIIDTESPEGRALVALAKLGDYVLLEVGPLATVWIATVAVRYGLLHDDTWHRTDLAKLPEGL